MARPAPGVERTVALITFLSKHPGRSFALSELARRLDLNKATAHSMLTTLTQAGWLIRNPADKTYRLGPSLVAIGDAAGGADRHALELARPAMRRLGDELDVPVVASAVVGDEIVILGVEGPVTPMGLGPAPGHRVPLLPPVGTVFMAFSDPEDVDRWLHAVRPPLDAERLAVYRRALATVRRRGYAVTLASDRRPRFGAALTTLGDDGDHDDGRRASGRTATSVDPDDDDYLLLDMRPVDSYHIAMVSAPVFDSTGHVTLAISLTAFSEPRTAAQVRAIARRLTAVTSSITTAIGGRKPAVARA